MEAPSDAERLKAFAPVQEMMTYVQFANDECDYGMGLELGMDLFCHGSHVSEHTLPSLPALHPLRAPPPPAHCCPQVQHAGYGFSLNFKMNILK